MTSQYILTELAFFAIKHGLSAHERDCLIRIVNKVPNKTDYMLDKLIKPIYNYKNFPLFPYIDEWFSGTSIAYIRPYEKAHSNDDIVRLRCTQCTGRFSVYEQSKELFGLCPLCDIEKKMKERNECA